MILFLYKEKVENIQQILVWREKNGKSDSKITKENIRINRISA